MRAAFASALRGVWKQVSTWRLHFLLKLGLLVICLSLLWMATSMAIRSGMFGLSGTPSQNQLSILLTFIGGAAAAAATIFTTVIASQHNERERWRLRLEAVIKSLDALPPGSPARVAGVLSAMTLLGQERIAIRVLEPAWQAGHVDHGTATWLIGQVLAGDRTHKDRMDRDVTDEEAITEAAALLRNQASQLTDVGTGMFYFPGYFLTRWSTREGLSRRVKNHLLLSMGQVLVSREKEYWSPTGKAPGWPTSVLVECVTEDPDEVIRSSAAVLLGALHDCFPEHFVASFSPDTLKAVQAEAAAAQARGVSREYFVLADRIRRDWRIVPEQPAA